MSTVFAHLLHYLKVPILVTRAPHEQRVDISGAAPARTSTCLACKTSGNQPSTCNSWVRGQPHASHSAPAAPSDFHRYRQRLTGQTRDRRDHRASVRDYRTTRVPAHRRAAINRCSPGSLAGELPYGRKDGAEWVCEAESSSTGILSFDATSRRRFPETMLPGPSLRSRGVNPRPRVGAPSQKADRRCRSQDHPYICMSVDGVISTRATPAFRSLPAYAGTANAKASIRPAILMYTSS